VAVLAVQRSKIGGTDLTFPAAAAGGDSFAPGERVVLHVRNGDAAAKTVTVVVPGNTKYGQAAPDVAVIVPAGGQTAIGPFPPDLADPADGNVDVLYSAVTAVTVALVGV
jgi:hypothetical protein